MATSTLPRLLGTALLCTATLTGCISDAQRARNAERFGSFNWDAYYRTLNQQQQERQQENAIRQQQGWQQDMLNAQRQLLQQQQDMQQQQMLNSNRTITCVRNGPWINCH